jgi:hypothetical protein
MLSRNAKIVPWCTRESEQHVSRCLQFARVAHRRVRFSLLAAALLGAFFCLAPVSQADVGVLLNESLDTSVARITGSGHSAIYFSNICPDSPIKLRLCRDGEEGSVMSNYTTLGEDRPFEWNIVPLSMYLYGVENAANRPLFGTWKIKRALEERYRDSILAAYCATDSCRTSNKAEWREMVGATLERSIYGFIISTTIAQDQAFIDKFNALPNENHFNGVTNNCANFTRRVLNTYFPKSAHADYINDFGMTSPKAIARSFAHYGEHHPESNFYVLHFAQLPGTIKRSSECRSGTEQLYHSKKLLIPMAIFLPHELGVVAASYVLTGRFNPEHELERHPSAEASELDQEIREAKAEKDKVRKAELQALLSEQMDDLVGTSFQWKRYREQFDALAEQAVRSEVVPDREFLDRFFKFLDHSADLSVAPDGSMWMDIAEGGKASKLGISASNVSASGSDAQWAYALTLARAGYYLNSPKHSRETMPHFKSDWSLLESARASSSDSSVTASTAPSAASRGGSGASGTFQPF